MILDLFAGPGGWEEGLRLLGRTDVVGVEMDRDMVATRRAAGLGTIASDVRDLEPADFYGWEGLIASPPCQTFSSAGNQAGLSDLRGQLVWEVVRFAEGMRPAWIACENVKEVLPIWRAIAAHLRRMGYQAWAGILNAADYGVPQSRKRAFLLASVHPFNLPQPTHTANDGAGLFGDDLPSWLTMADALGLDPDDLDAGQSWALERPATTVVRSFRPDVIAAPGWRGPGDGPRQNAPGSITVTTDQLRALQGVRGDFPVVASRTKTWSILGAFLPPPWAAAILRPLIEAGSYAVCIECGNDAPADQMTTCSDCMEETP